jgi:hypothetical protein
MLFIELIGGMMALALFVLLLTQIVMPLLFGTPFFPLFRKESPMMTKVHDLELEVEVTNELVRLEEQLFELDQVRKSLEKRLADLSKP